MSLLCRLLGHAWAPLHPVRYDVYTGTATVGGRPWRGPVTRVTDEACRRCGPRVVLADVTAEQAAEAPRACGNPVCRLCGERPVAVEVEGRVLVCRECAADPEVREWAKEDWR